MKTVTTTGYGGDFDVTVSIGADGTVQDVQIVEAGFHETDGIGSQALQADFLTQFRGKSGPLAYGNGIDAIAGATITSNAVLKAVNEALGTPADAATQPVAGTEEAGDDGREEAGDDDREEVAATSAPAAGDGMVTLETPDANGAVMIYTETVRGFANEVVVKVGLDDNGTIVSLTVGGPHFSETEYYGAQAQTNAFRSQFIGKTGPFVYGEGVDAIAGATVTSTAVLQAINDCLAQARQP